MYAHTLREYDSGGILRRLAVLLEGSETPSVSFYSRRMTSMHLILRK